MKVLAWPAPSRLQTNPVTALVYSEFETAGVHVEPYSSWTMREPAADVFHVHWPEAILWGRAANHTPFMAKLAAHHALRTMDVVRRKGGAVVWTIHNVAPHAFATHQHERVWAQFFPKFRRKVDALIGLTARSLDLVADTYPELRDRPRAVVPHPHYRTSYPAPPAHAEARTAIGVPVDHFVTAMIGIIRRSKGIPRAVEAFRKARRRKETLYLCGHCPDAELTAEIRSAIADDDSIIFDNRPLPDADLVRCFAAADAILINQGSTLNSGTLLLALSMDRPAIAPARGSVVELAETVGPGWIATFPGELAPAELRTCLDALQGQQRSARAPLDPYDPAAVSRATIAALRDALARRRAARNLHVAV
jgi:glycosyltransferase involved in cell wall biosynthesis